MSRFLRMTILLLLASSPIAFYIPALANSAGVVERAIENGVEFARRVEVTFQWRTEGEAGTGKEAIDLLKRKGFALSVSVTQTSGSPSSSFLLTARRSCVFTKDELTALVKEVDQFTRGSGTVTWSISQSK